MKKILIINTTINKGGAAKIAKGLFENLGKDFDITFAYGRGRKEKNSKTFFFGNKLETFVHIFLVRFLGIEGHGSYFSTKKLIQFIEKENFDLINIHNMHGYYLNFFKLLNFVNKKKIQIVYSVHDEWPITCLPAHSLGCNHCKTGIGKCSNVYSYPKNYFSIFTKYTLNKKKEMFTSLADMRIICPSVWLKNSLENSFLNKFEITTIFNYIDIDIFKPTNEKDVLQDKYHLPTGMKFILFIASNLNDKSKGVREFKEIAKILNNRNYLFITAGDGKVVGDKIINLGYIDEKQKLADIYALSDLFCFASSAETFLLTAAESLSCGTPVVGFDIPVVRELVNENVGVLTKNNPQALASIIDSLLKNDAQRLEMGKKGRLLIEEKYSQTIFCNKYKELYEQK